MSHTEDRTSLYDRVCVACSREVTRSYSTSFSWSIRALSPDIRGAIYSIYGFVRLADEIVDSLHEFDQATLLTEFRDATRRALAERISLNPILQAFQIAYHGYGIDPAHVERFLQSMEWDLDKDRYDRAGFDSYIVGSAEVVGLMCLKVFVRGDEAEYSRLEPAAISLGAAFQKVNFLRDLREDYVELGRTYFPDVQMAEFDDTAKREIEDEIERDLAAARKGILKLPRDARFGVYLAYSYYRRLLGRIRRQSSQDIMETRVRVPDYEKLILLAGAYARNRFTRIRP